MVNSSGGSNSTSAPMNVTSESQQNNGGVGGGLNENLDTSYIDVPTEDTTILANITRGITQTVGKCCKPRQMLVVLRLLKAITFCFLVLTVAADLMFIIFVEIVAGDEVGDAYGGFRDTTIRIYGLALAFIAILIELDISAAIRHFSGLKAFLPRSLLLFFIATITNAHPLARQEQQTNYQYEDDEAVVDDDDNSLVKAQTQIPNSAIVFQMVTSWVVALCAMTYFFLGLLCFDRFTSRAFISSSDPVVSTAIPQPSPSRPGKGEQAESPYEPPSSV